MLCGWISVPVLLCVVLWTGKPVRSASIEARKTSDVLEKKAHGISLFDRESDSDKNVRSLLRASREQSGLLEALREAGVEKKYLKKNTKLEGRDYFDAIGIGKRANKKEKKNSKMEGRDYFDAIGIGKRSVGEDNEVKMKDRDYFDTIGIGQNSYGNSNPWDQGYQYGSQPVDTWKNDEDVHGYPVAPANSWDDYESDAVYDDEYSGFE